MPKFLLAFAIALGTAGTALAGGIDEMNLGGRAMQRGEFAPAVEHMTRAIESGELGPEYLAATHLSRGQARYHLADYEGAIKDFTASMDADVMNARLTGIALGSRASAYRQLGRYDEAIADFDQAIALQAGGAALYYHRGLTHATNGDSAKAATDFERAYEMAPDNAIYRDKMIELGRDIE